MKKKFLFLTLFVLMSTLTICSQTKVSGVVVDKQSQPIPFANIVFKNSSEGIVANEDGLFYLESAKNYNLILISSVGFSEKEITLEKPVTYNMKIQLNGAESLNEVVIYTGKTSKKNNPALDILRKIWEKKRKNGLYLFNQYQLEKYEKVEFDVNSIDSAFMKNRLFKGMEFIFNQMDTSKVTGKTYLPIFVNEALADVYGDLKLKKVKEKIKANKTSGFNGNQQILSFVKDLYSNYDIYNNYLTFFDKSFTSPLSKTGIDVYNYILRDSAYIDDKWCYNIVFYPRRKNELTFKGDFWVNDSTFAIKKINMAVTKSANINWVKDIYLEQEFEVVSDSVFLLTKDYLMSDFAINKKEKSKGVYGKRTTFFRNHKFNIEMPPAFYKDEVNYLDPDVYGKSDEYWEENRFENLSKDELGVYKMLDTLQTVKRFKQIYSTVQILGSGFVQFGNFDYGPIFSTFGYNEVEGVRLRMGGRTYFGVNDTWRLQGYTAYGFNDDKFKYGFSGKWMLDKKNRLIISGGNRRDIEQIGASLTTTYDVLGRSFASSAVFASGNNGKLTSINLSNIAIEIEPVKNLTFQSGISYRTLESASNTFSLDYFTDSVNGITKSDVKQSEINLQVEYTPKRKTIGFAVERENVDSPYSRFFVNYSHGFKGLLDSDFQYDKIQLYYKQPFIIGPLGRTNFIIELGKTFGTVPLGLMSVIPGNQTFFTVENAFNNLNFYEFVSDQYATFQWNHNFNGRLFSRIPFMRKLNWREVVSVKGVYGNISDANRAINASGLIYTAPEKGYWEYSAGIGNIFKLLRVDFTWRGNYLNVPDANRFTIKGSFGFNF
ncbi:MAG: carboxypeptidase-like regulatory domain-containing protein [Flavobacterium micromati]|nr:carboxypeptidase-like regulatory domain-containing protein [Flavobacterium micromati]